MNSMKRVWMVMAVCFCFAFMLSLDSVRAQAEKSDKIQPEKKISGAQVIRLHYVGGVQPATVTVKPGTTVIWINEAESPVEIQFSGKQVTMACQNPVHFVIDDKGSFMSNEIPMGAVASLCFIEKGEFNYVVRRAGKVSLSYREKPAEFRGKVIVQE